MIREDEDRWIRPLEQYQSHRNLPQVAGLCTVAEAARPGLSIEQCVTRLKRYHYSLKRLHQIFTSRITAEPIYELKTAFSHHAYLCRARGGASQTRDRDARAAVGFGRRSAPGLGSILRRNPRRADDGRTNGWHLRARGASLDRCARAPSGRHQLVGRRAERARVPLCRCSSSTTC